MNWTKLLETLKQDSTWKGIVGILTVCGVAIQPEQGEAIIAAGLAIISLINVFVTK